MLKNGGNLIMVPSFLCSPFALASCWSPLAPRRARLSRQLPCQLHFQILPCSLRFAVALASATPAARWARPRAIL